MNRVDQEILPASSRDESSSAQRIAASTDPSAMPPADRRKRTVLICAVSALLLAAVGLVFGQTRGHPFLNFDDNGYVFDNPHVTPGLTLSGLKWALTSGPYDEWYPTTMLSHMLDCQFYGVEPWGHHLTSVLLHGVSTVLLFLVLLRMTGKLAGPSATTLWPSAWVAAVFAIHPLHVESVAWVAERRDMVSGLFFMLTLAAYTFYVESPSLVRYLAVAVLLALGLMAKPILVTLPCVLLLLDYWPLGRFAAAGPNPLSATSWLGRLPIGWRLVLEKIPLLALSAASCAITLSLHSPSATEDEIAQLSLFSRLANALVSYVAYLGQSLVPVDLAVFYPIELHLPLAWVGGSLVLLAAITALAVGLWRRRPYLLVGWLWFVGMLVPVIGLVPTIGVCHARADRYTYLSQIGLSIALAWSVWSVYQSRQALAPAAWRTWLLAGVSGLSVLALGAVAFRQTTYWRDDETLWTHALACDPQDWAASTNIASIRSRQGRTDEAIAGLREALESDFLGPKARASYQRLLADVLTQQGRSDEALGLLETAVQIFPAGSESHAALAAALAAKGDHDRALSEWALTARLAPHNWPARLAYANELFNQDHPAEAAEECQAVLDRQPDSIEAKTLLQMALAAQRDAAVLGPARPSSSVTEPPAKAPE